MRRGGFDEVAKAGPGFGSGFSARLSDRGARRLCREIRLEVESGEQALPLALVHGGDSECPICSVSTGVWK